MSKMSPTQLSKRYLQDKSYYVEVTEKWNPFAKIRQDLFGFIDLLCISPANVIVGVQTTSKKNISARTNKILANKVYPLFKAAGAGVVVHGWYKDKSGHWAVEERWL